VRPAGASFWAKGAVETGAVETGAVETGAVETGTVETSTIEQMPTGHCASSRAVSPCCGLIYEDAESHGRKTR
jgi:hypothetical protein